MAALLIFDGDCGFCTSAANWIQLRWGQTVEIVPYQYCKLAVFDLDTKQASEKVYLISGGHKFSGHEVIAELLRLKKVPGSKFLANFITSRPIAPVSAWVYDQIAKNRHRLPGGTPACQMPRR